MSKSKHKLSGTASHKIAMAHHRNDFLCSLKQFCDKTIGPNIFKLIPEKELENIYLLRSRPIKIRDIQNVPADVLKDYKHIIPQLLRINFLDFGVGEISQISLYDYFTTGLTIILYAGRIKTIDFKEAEAVKNAMKPLAILAESEIYNNAWKKLFEITNSMGVLNNDLSSKIFVLKHEVSIEVNSINGFYNCVDIYGLQTEKIQVVIDDNNRPALKIAYGIPTPEPHLEFLTLNPEDLGLSAGRPLDVYIQSHALNRLSERLDGILLGVLHFNLFNSLKQLKFTKNKKDEYLFEYTIFGKKVGYLFGSIINGKMIIRTFLFLTHDGTPEGNKLNNSTGLKKEDQKYLAIDKLSAFIHSDISQHPIIKEIFIKAGCQSLFEIDDEIIYSQETLKEKSNAALIAQYLKLTPNQ